MGEFISLKILKVLIKINEIKLNYYNYIDFK